MVVSDCCGWDRGAARSTHEVATLLTKSLAADATHLLDMRWLRILVNRSVYIVESMCCCRICMISKLEDASVCELQTFLG